MDFEKQTPVTVQSFHYDLTDENLYAYVTDADYKNMVAEHIIKAGYFKYGFREWIVGAFATKTF